MPTVAKLLRLFGKTPVALADADGVADGVELVNSFLSGNTDADKRASTLGFSSAQHMAGAIFTDFCKLVDSRWSEISSRAETHPYWINRKSGEEVLAQRRSALCTLHITDDSELTNLATDGIWVTIKARFTALLDLLEQCGLFVLRKGSIESYYLNSDQFTSIGKPSAAVSEIDYLNQLTHGNVESAYSDVVRCIRHASNAEVICEADALRDLLLSVVAPAHARLKSGDSSSNFNMLARSILGERSKIFGLVIEKEKLIVSIESKILNISGFPVTIGKDDDVLRSINAALITNV